jgi:hypothetical protein
MRGCTFAGSKGCRRIGWKAFFRMSRTRRARGRRHNSEQAISLAAPKRLFDMSIARFEGRERRFEPSGAKVHAGRWRGCIDGSNLTSLERH